MQPVRKRRRALVVVAVCGLVGIVGALAPSAWIKLRTEGHIHRVENAPEAPVALVFGAGLSASGAPSPFLAARLDIAARLLTEGKAKVILVSGDNRVKSYDEPTAMKDYLVAKGLPADRIVADFAGRDTYDSCARAIRIFGVTKATLVSQAYHLPRAVATCRALGVDAEGVGDWSARRYDGAWSQGVLRERLAAFKTVWDLAIHRDPVLGPRETSVTDILGTTP
jgi:vancomycin permeability regulator SanA